MIIARRSFLRGLFAAPAIIAIDRLMPIRGIIMPPVPEVIVPPTTRIISLAQVRSTGFFEYALGYPNHPGVAGPCEFPDGSKWTGFDWVRGPRSA